MIATKDSRLEKLSIHYITDDKQFIQSEDSALLESADVREWLTLYFLRSFSDLQVWTFTHETGLNFNEVYSFAKHIFSNADAFHEQSVHILKQLVKSSQHHGIKAGELFVALITNIQLGEKTCLGLAIVKSENKTAFLTVKNVKKHFELNTQQGLDLKKIDKGCLILDTTAGFDVLIIDNSSKGAEAQYWKNLFLGLELKVNDQYLTDNYLTLTKDFITHELKTHVEIDKADQIDLLNRSVNYFKKKENFKEEEFLQEVFSDQNVVESFKSFKQVRREDYNLQLEDDFNISPAVVKKQARIFKSVIKLDRNFHIYIHGNRSLIEQGFDERVGKKFYKIYFDEEQ